MTAKSGLPAREEIMEALYKLVSEAYAFKTRERDLRDYADVSTDDMPYIGMAEGSETTVDGNKMLPRTILEVEFYIYVNAAKDKKTPAKALNDPLDAVSGILKPNPLTGVLDLEGLVDSVYKEGRTVKVPGYGGGVGVAIVPLKIQVPWI